MSKFDSAIILNQPSLDKFVDNVKPGGLILYETSSVITPSTRTDIESLGVDAQEEARKLNKKQIANMIMLGAFLERRPIVSHKNVIKALKEVLPERHHHLLSLNEEALMRGKQIAVESAHETVV